MLRRDCQTTRPQALQNRPCSNPTYTNEKLSPPERVSLVFDPVHPNSTIEPCAKNWGLEPFVLYVYYTTSSSISQHLNHKDNYPCTVVIMK